MNTGSTKLRRNMWISTFLLPQGPPPPGGPGDAVEAHGGGLEGRFVCEGGDVAGALEGVHEVVAENGVAEEEVGGLVWEGVLQPFVSVEVKKEGGR